MDAPCTFLPSIFSLLFFFFIGLDLFEFSSVWIYLLWMIYLFVCFIIIIIIDLFLLFFLLLLLN